MKYSEEEIVSFARSKAIREHRTIWVYQDKNRKGDYYISPREIESEEYVSVDTIVPDDLDSDIIEKRLVRIDDYRTIREGDQVLIDGEPEQVVKVTTRQIETHTGKKFRKSDGSEWGVDDGGHSITKKIVF